MLTYSKNKIVIHRSQRTTMKTITAEMIKGSKEHDEKLLKFPCNDTGNAGRFLLFCSSFVVFDCSKQEWLYWNGKVWLSNATFEIYGLAIAVMNKYYETAVAAEKSNELDKEVKRELVRHAKISCNNEKIQSMLKTALYLNYVKEMKAKPYLLNVSNGVIDLRKKELYPHDPRYGCTHLCNVEYNPKVHSKRFKKFLHEIFSDDEDLIRYVQKMFGYAVTGEHCEEKLFFLYGSGGNGKSKLIDAIRHTVGNLSASVPVTALTKTHSGTGQPTPELVPLIRKRMAFCSEIKGDDVLNDSTIKQLTGNESISVRKMRQEYIETDIEFKLFVDTNFMPYFKHYDYAIERRVVVIPFKKNFEEEERDQHLSEKLKSDKEYILKWLVNGAYRYYKKGLEEPEEVRLENQNFIKMSDSVGAFICDRIVQSPRDKIKSSELHKIYVQYCYEHSYDALGSKSFSQEMQKRKFHCKSEKSANFFQNISIL